MAEVEYGGIKVTGGKLLLIFPLLGTLGGGLWGGFEFYKDYMTMKEQIQNYVAPDLSAIDRQLGVVSQEFDGLKEADSLMNQLISQQVNSVKEVVSDMQTTVMDMRMELKSDMVEMNDTLDRATDKVDDRIDAQDDRNRDNVETVRGIINSFEIRMDAKIDRLDEKIDNLEADLDKKIRDALDNPLVNQ